MQSRSERRFADAVRSHINKQPTPSINQTRAAPDVFHVPRPFSRANKRPTRGGMGLRSEFRGGLALAIVLLLLQPFELCTVPKTA